MAVETSAELLAQLRDEVGFDVSGGDVTLLGWLNARHRRMVERSRCFRKRLAVGPTVAGTSDYTLPPEVLEVRLVEVGLVPYDYASRREVLEVRNASAVFVARSGEGLVARGVSASGSEVLSIYPTPTVSGTEIAVTGPVRAPELTVSGVAGAGATNSPVVPPEFFDALVHGAASTGLKRTEARMNDAAAYDSEFDAATEELRRQTRARWNTGPSRVSIVWPA